jgi:hypothetical protein
MEKANVTHLGALPSCRASSRKGGHHFHEAAKYYQSEEIEKAAHHAYLAHGHSQQANHHAAGAAKLHAERYDNPATPASGQAIDKKSAA